MKITLLLKRATFLLFLPVVLLLQSCRLGDAVCPQKSDSHYYSRNKKFIIYSPMGNWIELGYNEMKEVDMASFEVLSRDWSKDKHTVYWKYTALPDIDVASFRIIGGSIACDARHVYDIGDYPVKVNIIEGADPTTLKIVDRYWMKDKNRYYVNLNEFEGKDTVYAVHDYQSFELINSYFAKDTAHLYFLKFAPEVRTERRSSGELVLLDEYYIRTNDTIYYCDGKKIGIKNPNSIALVSGDNLLKVDGTLYDRATPLYIEGADVESLEFFNGTFAKDKNQVYDVSYNDETNLCEFHILRDADPATIRNINHYYCADKNHVYFSGEIVEGASPETFKPVNNSMKVDAEDRKKRYLRGKLVE